MVDSDDSQIELAGDCRGSDMPDKEWEAYEPSYRKALDRYEKSTPERQAEKIKFFNDKFAELDMGDCDDAESWGHLFWVREGGETGWDMYWTSI